MTGFGGRLARWSVLLPPLAVLLLYLPARGYDLVWDDVLFLSGKIQEPLLEAVGNSLTRPFELSANYYRPAAMLSFLVDRVLADGGPAAMHLHNILLHAVNALLVALIALGLRSGGFGEAKPGAAWLPALAGLLWALHPALVEAVAFVSGRFDLLLTCFLLLGLLADLSLRGRPGLRPALVGLAFLLAVASKESAVAFVPALALVHAASVPGGLGSPAKAWRALRAGGHLPVHGAMLLAALLCLAARVAVLGHVFNASIGGLVPAGGPLSHLLLVGRSAGTYLLLAVFPFGTLAPIHHATLPVPAGELPAWLGLLAAVVATGAAAALAIRGSRPAALALAALTGLLPAVNIVPLQLAGGSYAAERYLTFPLALGVLAGVVAAGRLGPLPRLVASALAAAFLAAGAVAVHLTLPRWADSGSLWSWGAERAPGSALPLSNLAARHFETGSFEEGRATAERAIALDPRNTDAWNNLATNLYGLGRPREAAEAFRRAGATEPGSAMLRANLGLAILAAGDVDGAVRILRDEALPLDPLDPITNLNLARAYLVAVRPDLAVAHLDAAASRLPPGREAALREMRKESRDPIRWLVLGDRRLEARDPAGALAAYRRGQALGAPPEPAAIGLSSALLDLGRLDEAAAILDEALPRFPGNASLHYNAGRLGKQRGDRDAAAAGFSRCLELDPGFAPARHELLALGR
jgi:tetratricopeptide (TPR) repeat protein